MKSLLTDVRCTCGRLLFRQEPDALAGALQIKCPRCRTVTTLRPRALSQSAAERVSEGPNHGTHRP